MKKLDLLDYASNTYSQFGEDGVIAHAFSVMGERSRVCVEFGAWDGLYHSNTANLWSHGWKGILIESDGNKFRELQRNAEGHNCVCIHTRVGVEGENTLERILAAHGEREEVDFLSIDVDGDDYYMLGSLESLRPRLIACEYNPTVPPDMELVSAPGNYFGCSAKSLALLAETKGYRLIAVTESNCFFVTEEEFGRFAEYETSLDELAIRKNLTYLVTGYNGDYVLSREPTFGFRYASDQQFVRFDGVSVYEEPQGVQGNVVRKVWRRFAGFLGEVFNYIERHYTAGLRRRVKDSLATVAWRIRGAGPPPAVIKQKNVMRIAEKFGPTIFVETGTYQGDMVEAVRDCFKRLVSIELSLDLYFKAKKRFENEDHIEILQGDSATVLSDVVPTLEGSALFWLDAHYLAETAVKGGDDTPIKEELTHILKDKRFVHYIIIDDARCFTGEGEYRRYARIDDLREFILSMDPDLTFTVKDDAIRVLPRQD